MSDFVASRTLEGACDSGGSQKNWLTKKLALGEVGGGRLASVDGPLAGDTVTMTYDELGRPAQQAIAWIARDFVFDAAARLNRETNPLGQFNCLALF